MEPGSIKKLDEAVVNRIAAGEIIQKPANALKELIENSLDAKASHIQITVKAGGLKLLQIQDNGTGIRREDLGIVCERFTTSKLTQFEDLSNIATFGFRGEALASISHVAHLSIQTKTALEVCGYKAAYEDGKLRAPAKACAGNQGTIITVEDLFYNMPQRRQCLKSPTEEFQKISDVVAKYAVHNAHAAFTLKKFGEQPTVRTVARNTREEHIRTIYGAQIAKELLAVQLQDDTHKFSMNALITKVNYAAKRGTMLLFINQRLVESAALKTAIDGVYSTYLPRGMHPFVYISLEMAPTQLDVNVHPTKHEVHFLYEDEIIDKIKRQIELQLLGSNAARTFYKQLRLPALSLSQDVAAAADTNTESRSQSTSKDKTNAKDKVRTDAKEQKLEKFLVQHENIACSGQLTKCDSATSNASSTSIARDVADESFRVVAARKSKEVRLSSVLNMQQSVENKLNVLLRKTMKEMVFVGVVDAKFALFQHETKLYLCNTLKFCEELFYQRLVYDFQNLSHIKIEPPLDVKQLVQIALDTEESGWCAEDGDKCELASRAACILQEKSSILREYFSLCINEAGALETVPALLDKHLPSSTHLPVYMLRLATEVEWESEEACFATFCRETARYYTLTSAVEMEATPQRHKWLVEHVFYPAFKRYLLPPDKLKQHIYELTSLPRLYKVFERC